MNKILVVIPARMKSSRYPGKPLAKIWGKEMILHTYNRALLAGINKRNIVVAIDADKTLAGLLQENGIEFEVVEDAITGTDRLAEVAKRRKAEYYINLQGDEPLMPINNISNFYNFCSDAVLGEVFIGYAKCSPQEKKSSKVPKLVFSESQTLLYISRASIPGNKFDNPEIGYKQVCIYGFDRNVLLNNYSNKKAYFEEVEDIEILRLLEKDIRISCVECEDSGISVDYQEDVQLIENTYDKDDYLGL
jgi:3-deoxy-manno-octulosonate cytidylyltransferase (CMP-KDO synthetase)